MAVTALLLLVFSCFSLLLSTSRAQVCTPQTGDPTHCICVTPDGVIDVRSIGNPDKTAKWSRLVDGNQYPYGFNPCYGYSTSTDCSNAVACQQAGDTIYDCGSISTGAFYYDGSTSYLQYTDGDENRITQVNLICDMTADEPKATALGDSFDKLLFYEFDVHTKCACPGVCFGGSGGVAPGEVGLVLIFLSIGAFGAYFVVGALVMYFKFEKRGIDMIPQKDFWLSVPFLIKDGVMFTFRPIIDRVRGGTAERNGYSEL